VSERLRRVCRGVRGGAGGRSPPRGGSGAGPPNFFFLADIFSPGRHISGPTYFRRADIFSGRHIFARLTYFRDDIFPGPHDIRWFSAHGFLPMVF
jgi:hypothetical protein